MEWWMALRRRAALPVGGWSGTVSCGRELGCISVSSMIHVPKAHTAFDEDGTPTEGRDRWASYGARTWSQLEWWGNAAAAHRVVKDPFEESEALLGSPAQRNAPTAAAAAEAQADPVEGSTS